MANVESIVEQLKNLLDQPSELAAGIARVQQQIWSAPKDGDPQWEILRDLAYDLDYYQPKERVRSEDASFYGDERALSEIRGALARLEQGRGER